jgi:hypothetical protein
MERRFKIKANRDGGYDLYRRGEREPLANFASRAAAQQAAREQSLEGIEIDKREAPSLGLLDSDEQVNSPLGFILPLLIGLGALLLVFITAYLISLF